MGAVKLVHHEREIKEMGKILKGLASTHNTSIHTQAYYLPLKYHRKRLLHIGKHELMFRGEQCGTRIRPLAASV